MSTGEAFQEIYLCPEHNSLPAGVRMGPLLFAPGLASLDPCTGRLLGDDLEAQLRGAFANVRRFLEAAGAGPEHIARVTVFMSELTNRQLINVVWKEWYPDPNDRPPHKYVPTVLPAGMLVRLQVMALMGAGRRVLEIPGIVHQDWMSMGALTGNLVTSSRVVTGQRVEDPDEHTRQLFANVNLLLQDAGGDLRNLTQVTAFVGDAKYGENVAKELKRVVGDKPGGPKLHVLETNLGGGPLPRLEILGLV